MSRNPTCCPVASHDDRRMVRQTLSQARRNEPLAEVEEKLASVRASVRHEFPAGDIEVTLAEIERGYGKPLEP